MTQVVPNDKVVFLCDRERTLRTRVQEKPDDIAARLDLAARPQLYGVAEWDHDTEGITWNARNCTTTPPESRSRAEDIQQSGANYVVQKTSARTASGCNIRIPECRSCTGARPRPPLRRWQLRSRLPSRTRLGSWTILRLPRLLRPLLSSRFQLRILQLARVRLRSWLLRGLL